MGEHSQEVIEIEENLLVDKAKITKDNQKTENLLMNQGELSYRLTNKRWLGLFLACMCMFGSYYCYDNPQALQTGLQDRMGLTDIQYNWLYSVYSLPNVIMPLIGGLVIDKMGVRSGCFVFTFVLIIGQTIFMLGGTYENYLVMIGGRFVFGLGGECLVVSTSTVISQWFKASELAFALGLSITCSRLGSSVNSALTPYLYESQKDTAHPFFWPTFMGVMACIFSWLCGLGLIYMDKESDRREGKLQDDKRTSQTDPSEQVRLSDIKNFSSKLWILNTNCALIYGAFFTFNGNGNAILHNMYGISSSTAGLYLLTVYMSASFITPIFGLIVDKYARRVIMMIISVCIFVAALLIFLSIPSDCNALLPLIPLILTGIFYSTYAAIFWPCIPIVVEPKMCGTAFGVVNAVQNINLAISPLIFAAIKNATKSMEDSRGGYVYGFTFLMAQLLVAFLLSFVLYYKDMKTNQALNSVSKTRSSRLTKSSMIRR